VLLLAVLAACSSDGGHRSSTGLPSAAANAAAIHAIGLVGTPYRYGGNTPAGGFDCSGLVGYVFRESAGIGLPRTTSDIAALPAERIGVKDLRTGDLVLFGQRGRVDHIGIYVGEGRFVHAPSSGGTVRLDRLDGRYWQQRWIGGRRLIR
jgi:cell wall-associated NlpC family hydrolase